MTQQQVSFPGCDGSARRGILHRCLGPQRAVAIFAHCFTCTKDFRASRVVASALAEVGVTTLRFDFAGLGESDGEFEHFGFSADVADIVAAAAYLKEHVAEASLLVGHSLGGAAVVAAAPRIASITAVATIGAPCHPEHVTHLFASSANEIEASGRADVTLAGRVFSIQKSFIDDLKAQTPESILQSLNAALLVMHAPGDTIVGIENAQHVYESARHPKSFVSLDSADHLLTRAADARYAARVLAAWAERYIAPEPTLGTTGGEVHVSGRGPGFTHRIRAGKHDWLADEPKSVAGAADLGPSPYDHLLAGLGACTAMTLRMYADRKKLPVDGVDVVLRHRRETVDGKVVETIERDIRILGELEDSVRARMMEIADRCPVHRTLERGPNVVTKEQL